MKNNAKFITLAFFTAGFLTACQGGFSGDKQDSTMVDKHAMDSTANQNTKAGTLGGPKGDSSTKNDTTAGTKNSNPVKR